MGRRELDYDEVERASALSQRERDMRGCKKLLALLIEHHPEHEGVACRSERAAKLADPGR